MTFLNPFFLYLLLPLIFFLWQNIHALSKSIHIIILILIVITLSHPIKEQTLIQVAVDAQDIIIAIDVSSSMKARDLIPNRYSFAKKTIVSLLNANPSANVMLIAFTSNPLLLSPPTTDHALIAIALESLNLEFILSKGTSLEKLFKKLSLLKTGHKHLILMTDGGEETQLTKLTTLLQKSNISLTVLALGTKQGTSIEQNNGTLLKNKEGNLVISRINPLLKSLAKVAKGSYLMASHSPKVTAQKITTILQDQKNKAQVIKKKQQKHTELYQVPLFLALLLFFILHTKFIKYLVVFLSIFTMPTQASIFDHYYLNLAYTSYAKNDFNTTQKQLQKIKDLSLQSQIMLANTHYKQNAFTKSIKIYKYIHSTSLQTKQQIYYNIANAYSMQKKYHKAKIYYTKVLQLGIDNDAKHNLDLIALLNDKKTAKLGIAHPKSQDTSSSKNESQDKKESKTEDEPSAGSGSDGKGNPHKKEKGKKLLNLMQESKYPLSSKVYELINKGYIHEKQPW